MIRVDNGKLGGKLKGMITSRDIDFIDESDADHSLSDVSMRLTLGVWLFVVLVTMVADDTSGKIDNGQIWLQLGRSK